MADLSILIPARNEMFLAKTIEDILSNIRGDTEIIAILDGAWADPQIPDHERVTLVYHPESIGQRAATNEAARLSEAEFVMKCDAHCAFDEGFDVKLTAQCKHDWTIIPEMRNLHVFDWQCKNCGNRMYMGPYPEFCFKEVKEGKVREKVKVCDNTDDFERVMVWEPRPRTRQRHMRFDRDLHFQYWSDYKQRAGRGDLVETMSLLGACWMMRRDRYWELDGMDERHGSWGQMGTEIACKTWLSGGQLLCNRTTWFAHMFRTQKGFGFPYPMSHRDQEKARQHSRWLWLDGNWPKAVHPLSWLVDKFAPIPDWHDTNVPRGTTENLSKAIVYYTDTRLNGELMPACQAQLKKAAGDIPIIAVSLKPVEFGDKNIVIEAERGPLTMFQQILAGIEAADADVVFFAEHDVLYHPSHFEFTPSLGDRYYYNENVWKVRVEDGHALFYYCNQTSGLCAHRKLLLQHYRERVRRVEQEGFSRRMGFEPGTHNRKERVDDYGAESWRSKVPNIDLRHQHNLTPNRWRKDQFRNQRYTEGWTEAEEVPGWGRTKDRMEEFLNGLSL